MARYITLEEAHRALPDVERIIRRLRRIREEARNLRNQLEDLWAALEGEAARLTEISESQGRLNGFREEFGALVQELEERGAVLRDLDLGLVDFPTMAGNAEIYLCWKVGEESIGFWHGLGEGYAGRKPLSVLRAPRRH
jgi:hypothetical protein